LWKGVRYFAWLGRSRVGLVCRLCICPGFVGWGRGGGVCGRGNLRILGVRRGVGRWKRWLGLRLSAFWGSGRGWGGPGLSVAEVWRVLWGWNGNWTVFVGSVQMFCRLPCGCGFKEFEDYFAMSFASGSLSTTILRLSWNLALALAPSISNFRSGGGSKLFPPKTFIFFCILTPTFLTSSLHPSITQPKIPLLFPWRGHCFSLKPLSALFISGFKKSEFNKDG
jgi:hypothetical protein